MDDTLSHTGRRASFKIWYVLPFLAALALIVFLYQGTFTWWWWEWTYPGSFYAHALFVPFFVAAMIWRDRDKLAKAPWDPSWQGIAYIVPSMALLMVAQRSDVTTIKSISFMLLILGICTMTAGKTRTRMLLFPLLFILMMMPLVPDQLINSIAFPIQLASARIATFLLNALTLHSTRVGTLIQMDSYKLAVELPCSGFKTLISLLTFTAAFAYLTEAAMWKRWTLFLATIPLSLIINALRITFIGIVGELVGSKAAATFHDYSGFIVLIMAFLFLFNFARILRCKRFMGIPLDDEEDENGNHKDASGEKTPIAEAAKEEDAGPPWHQQALLTARRALAARPTTRQVQTVMPYVFAINLLLLLTMGVEAFVIRPIVPQKPIARSQVPSHFEANGVMYDVVRNSRNDMLTKVIQETLSPTRVIQRNYRGSDGSDIELFITAGNGRKTFHDPHTCMLGVDAVMNDIQQIDIPGVPATAGSVRVLETHVKRADYPLDTEMMICYVVDGKIVPRTEDVRNRIIMQTLFGDNGLPSYFFRVTHNSAGTDETKRSQMINFIAGMWGQIGPVLKGEVKGDTSDPPPVPLSD